MRRGDRMIYHYDTGNLVEVKVLGAPEDFDSDDLVAFHGFPGWVVVRMPDGKVHPASANLLTHPEPGPWTCPNDCADPKPAIWNAPPGGVTPPCSNCDAPLAEALV